MAAEDIIIKALVEAGLQLDPASEKLLSDRLSEIGKALGEGSLAGLRDVSAELTRMRAGLERDMTHVADAAKRGIKASEMSSAERSALTNAYNRVKTYYDQLQGLNRELTKLGNMNLGEGADRGAKPIFDQLSSLQTTFAQLGKTVRSVAPLIDGITEAQKKHADELSKSRQKIRQDEMRDLRREAADRSKALRDISQRENRKAFYAGAQGGYLHTSKDDAQRAKTYARAELAYRQQMVELSVGKFGKDDPATRDAQKRAEAVAHHLAMIEDRISAATALDIKAKKDETTQRRVAKVERDIAINRASRSATESSGRKAFLAAGGQEFLTGGDMAASLARFTNADKAAKAVSFLNGELADSRTYLKTMSELMGDADPRVAKAAAQVQRLSNYLGGLKDRVNELRAAEKLTSDVEAKRDMLARNKVEVEQSRAQARAQNAVGAKLYDTGVDPALVTDKEQAKALHDYLRKELIATNQERRALTRAYGEGSAQEKAAIDRSLQLAEATGKARAQVEMLSKAQTEDSAKQRAQAVIDKEQGNRARSAKIRANDYALLSTNPAELTTLKDTNRALQAGRQDLSAMLRIQEALATTTGKTSDEYAKQNAEVQKLTEQLAALEQRKRALEVEAANRPRASERDNRGPQGGRSGVYGDGRESYRRARALGTGGLESLRGADRQGAIDYARARRAEIQRRYDYLSSTLGQNSTGAQQAAAGIREYDDALRRLSSSGAQAADRMSYLGNVFKMFLKYAVVYQGMYMLAGAVASLARGMAELQAQMLEIQAVTGSTDEQMQKLGMVVQSVASDSKFSLDELTKAAKTLAQAGVPIESMNTTLKATADFAAATGTNLETAADLISTTRDVFKELNDDVISNQLAKAINVSKLTGEDLKTILSLGAQTARDYNITSEQFLGAVATLRNAGLKASTTATGLRQAMLEIFTPDDKLTKALQTRYKQLGETMGAEAVRARFYEFTKADNPLVAALTELKRLGFNGEGQVLLGRAFDIRSANAIKAAIDNLKELSANEAKITFGRAAAEGAQTTIEGLNASFTRLYSTISGFTYNRSEGLLGWISEAASGLDRLIQKWQRQAELSDANRGRAPNDTVNDGQPKAPAPTTMGGKAWEATKQAASSVWNSFGQFTNPFTGLFNSASQVERVSRGQQGVYEDNVKGTNAIINRQQMQQQDLQNAARVWDTQAAARGEAPGTAAAVIVHAREQADLLRSTVSNVFGPDMAQQADALGQLVNSYTTLSESQRKVRRDELRQSNDQLAKLSDSDLDRALSQISQLRDSVNGTLEAFSSEMAAKVVKARKDIQKLDGRQPTTAAEIEASVTLELFKTDDAVQQIINGTSKLAADAQLDVMKTFSQKLSEKIMAGGGAVPVDAIIKNQVDVLKTQAKALVAASGDDLSAAIPSIRSEAAALAAQFKENTDANLNYLRTMVQVLKDAQKGAQGAVSFLLAQAAHDLEQITAMREQSVVADTAKRVAAGKEANTSLKNPLFTSYVDKMPDTNPAKATLQQAISAGGLPEGDYAGNTQTAKLVLDGVEKWHTATEQVQLATKQINEEVAKRAAQEDRAGALESKFNEARAANRFGEARSARAGMTAARLAIIDDERKQLQSKIELNVSANNPQANEELIKKSAELMAQRNKLLSDESRELSRLNQEEAKVNLNRATGAAQAKQARLKTVLDNVTADTPPEVINKAIAEYDANQAQLRDLFEQRKKLEGDTNQLSAEQEAEERKKLKNFRDQNAFLDMVQRQEQEVRARIVAQLDKKLTTGNPVVDAQMQDYGHEPGTRTQRAAYLVNQQAGYQRLLGSASTELASKRDQYAKNQVLLQNDPGNADLMKNQADLYKQIEALTNQTDAWNIKLGETTYQLQKVKVSFADAVTAGFNLNALILGLEQSGSSVEHLAGKIHEKLISAIEGVGDAFADALLEGKDFASSLDKLFLDTGKSILRDVIKTYTTETITGGLKMLSPSFRAEAAAPGAVPNPLGNGIGGLVKDGWNWLMGKTPADAAAATAATAAAPATAAPSGAFGLGASLLSGDKAGALGCCCGGGLGDAGGAAKAVATAAGSGNVLADVADKEGKGFFDTLKSGFSGLLDSVSGGFGKLLSGLGGLFTGGGGGGGGALGMFASLIPGFKNGGVIKAATGGIISGPGTGTSDSVPGFIRSRSGKLRPLLTSNGESILNARATKLLGESGVHALNAGDFVRADTAAIRRDISGMMAAQPAGGASSQPAPTRGRGGRDIRQTLLNVTPADMRMRLGDWLEQHVLEELSKR